MIINQEYEKNKIVNYNNWYPDTIIIDGLTFGVRSWPRRNTSKIIW